MKRDIFSGKLNYIVSRSNDVDSTRVEADYLLAEYDRLAKRIDDLETAIVDFAIPRDAVCWFAREMERKLRRHDDKGGWDTCKTADLMRWLKGEIEELADAIIAGDKSGIVNECADVANYAMMIADNTRGAK